MKKPAKIDKNILDIENEFNRIFNQQIKNTMIQGMNFSSYTIFSKPIPTPSDIKSFYKKQINNLVEEIIDETEKTLSELKRQNSLIVKGGVIKNAHNGGYILDDHQQRMNKLFDKEISKLVSFKK